MYKLNVENQWYMLEIQDQGHIRCNPVIGPTNVEGLIALLDQYLFHAKRHSRYLLDWDWKEDVVVEL